MVEKSEIAEAEFIDGNNCSQSVLLAFAEDFGLTPEIAARIATGFGGGIGRTGATCGALTGAVMVLGLKYGNIEPADKASKEHTLALVRSLLEQFRATYGAVECKALLNDLDIGDPEQHQQIRALGLFKTRCPLHVRDAAKIAEALLEAKQSN